MFKTFNDFVNLAARTYGLTKVEAVNELLDRLQFNGLSIRAIECYINWADNDTLTTTQIGNHLGIDQRTVCYYLKRLHEIWPHLFDFGPPVPHLSRMQRLPVGIDEELDMSVIHKF
jgi:hypothetical protein